MFKCSTFHCRYNKVEEDSCRYCILEDIELEDKTCQNYKPNICYYISEFISIFRESTIVPSQSLTGDVCIGGYYVIKIFDVFMKQYERADWTWFQFYHKDNPGKALTGLEILDLEINEDELIRLNNLLNDGFLPPFEDEKDKLLEEQKRKEEEFKQVSSEINLTKAQKDNFGFVTPTGDYIMGDFGEHTKVAYDIVKENKKWYEKFKVSDCEDAEDFLIEKENYILIHNPFGSGKVKIEHSKEKNITKKQAEFLYIWLTENNDYKQAQKFLAMMEDS